MREYLEELDGFRVGDLVVHTEEYVSATCPRSTWKITKLWRREFAGRVLHLSTLVCTDVGGYLKYNRRVGTQKNEVSTGWLAKVPS